MKANELVLFALVKNAQEDVIASIALWAAVILLAEHHWLCAIPAVIEAGAQMAYSAYWHRQWLAWMKEEENQDETDI